MIGSISELDGVETDVAAAASGAPESSWGDVFFSIPGQRLPFATIVFRDQPGFDESPRVDRDGVFRLNIAADRGVVRKRFGADDEHDSAALDSLFPHPVYAAHGWVSVFNLDTTAGEVSDLLRAAHTRATTRERELFGSPRHRRPLLERPDPHRCAVSLPEDGHEALLRSRPGVAPSPTRHPTRRTTKS